MADITVDTAELPEAVARRLVAFKNGWMKRICWPCLEGEWPCSHGQRG